MLQAEHSFWYYRAAPDGRSKQWMANLTPLNRKCFGTLHMYAQMFAIERLRPERSGLRDYFLEEPGRCVEDFQPSTFHVTIRHTDWWLWENETPLRFECDWFQRMLDQPDLRRTAVLKLELETLDYKVAQLNPIVQHISSMQSAELYSHVVDGQATMTKFVMSGQPVITSWSGPKEIDGQRYAQYQGLEELKYHVVTLTWRLHFPQYPNAHVPSLRLAPCNTDSSACSDSWDDSDTIHSLPLTTDADLDDDPEARKLQSSDRCLELGVVETEPFWPKWETLTNISPSLRETRSKAKRKFILETMRKHSLQTQYISAWQSGVERFCRRRRHLQFMRSHFRRSWQEKFAATNTLLRLKHRHEETG